MIYVSNAFSLNMIEYNLDMKVWHLSERPSDKVLASAKSVVGHQQIADIIGVPFNRETVELKGGDLLLVAQYKGPRLPEGATELPEGAAIKWVAVCFHYGWWTDIGNNNLRAFGYNIHEAGYGYNSLLRTTSFHGVELEREEIGS